MPDVMRPDGARIHYEVYGDGYPLLLLAPGGVNSQISFWERSAINPIKEFADEFKVIAMDQRHAGGSPAPAAKVTYAQMAADQIAVLDDAGVGAAHVMGGCIGVAYVMRIIHDAPDRISAAVGQDPVGLDNSNGHSVFTAMFDPTVKVALEQGMGAVVAAAVEQPMFVFDNRGGPFAQRIHDDEAFRAEILGMTAREYVALIDAFSAGLWPRGSAFFSVPEKWLKTCPAPLLILPGNDPFHPAGISTRICAEAPHATCLEPDCRSEGKLRATIGQVKDFLREHRPSQV
ncbi:MAG: alpha/beta fold hydrolase [Tepidiformaceae bacterium]